MNAQGSGWRPRRLAGRLLRGATSAYDRVAYPATDAPSEHLVRTVLNWAVDDYLEALGPATLTGAEISGSNHAWRRWRAYESLMYPEFDLCAPLELEHRFDVVVCEQVLEHVVDPCAAAVNLRGLCKPGGHVIVSTPFLIRIHELPEYEMRDYWRFTPRGIATLLERAGLEIADVGSWGNRQAVVGNLVRWSARRPWHSLRNEPDVAVQVWAFARNPA